MHEVEPPFDVISELIYRPIQKTRFVAWNHPNEGQTGTEREINTPEITTYLHELGKTNQLIVVVDAFPPSAFSDIGLTMLNNDVGMQKAFEMFPDGSIILAADPTRLNWLTMLDPRMDIFPKRKIARHIENPFIENLITRSPFLAFLVYMNYLLWQPNVELSRRTFLKLFGSFISGICGSGALTELIVNIAGNAKYRDLANFITEHNTYIFDPTIQPPFGLNERVISAMNKMHHVIRLLKEKKVYFDKPIQPVALYGSFHYMNGDHLEFAEKASSDHYATEIIEYLTKGAGTELVGKLIQDKTWYLENIRYDLTHAIVTQKRTNKDTEKPQLIPFKIPDIGFTIHPFDITI